MTRRKKKQLTKSQIKKKLRALIKELEWMSKHITTGKVITASNIATSVSISNAKIYVKLELDNLQTE